MSESRLYLYRKAGREVWDAEMWLPDGRRRVWRTGIADKDAAMAAARVRLEALAGVQTVAPIEGVCTVDDCAPEVSPEASAADAALLSERAPAPSCAATDAQPCASERPLMQVADTGAGVARPSEERAQSLQMPEKTQEMGALARFDRWFFSDLRRILGGHAS